MLKAALTGRLREIVGPEHVIEGGEALGPYLSDASGIEAATGPVGPGLGVAMPGSTAEMRQVVELALEERLPLVARGGGTGLWAGAVPVRGGLVVSTERMAGPPEINREDLYAVVGPGVPVKRFRAAVEAERLYYPIDPAGEALSTIGGSVAEGAEGLHGLRYGTTRNYVLGLELVTAEAGVLAVGARTVKSVAGYDVTRLVVGSEGTLGIVTSATLRVLPLPEERRVLAFAFGSNALAAEAAAETLEQGLGPVALEIMDQFTSRAVAEMAVAQSTGAGADVPQGPLLLIEFDGPRSLCEALAADLKDLMRSRYRIEAASEATGPDTERLWAIRRSALAALGRAFPTVIIRNFAVAPSKLAGLMERVSDTSEKQGIPLAVFGHAGQGVVHVAVLGDRGTQGFGEAAERVMARLASACGPLGARISGARGLGLAESPLRNAGLDEADREVLMRLKNAIDPKGIMNPDRI
jgi:glycolate oxidase